MKRTILALLISLAMIISLTACGGGGSEAPAGTEAAEPNAGLKGIVFSIPDGWTINDVGTNYANYTSPDSKSTLQVYKTEQSDIDEFEETSMSVQEYFDKYHKPTEEELADNELETEDIKACDSAGVLIGRKLGDGYAFKSASWIYDDIIYGLSINNFDNYDDNGQIKEDAVALSDEDLAAFDAVLASVKPGDGAAFQTGLDVDSLGDISFDAPEDYIVNYAEDKSVQLSNSDSSISLSVRLVDEEAFNEMEWEGEGVPANLDEYFESSKVDAEKTDIAGCEGYISKYPEEDGNFYDVNASFWLNDVMYEVSMYADAYDENGLKPDAVPLSDDDMAVFNSFLASMQQK